MRERRARGESRARSRTWVAILLAACTLGSGCHLIPPEGLWPSGDLSDAALEARFLDYVTFATQVVSPGSEQNLICHITREELDPGYTAPVGAWGANAWDAELAKVASLADTSDFDMLYMMTAYLAYYVDWGNPGEGHPAVVPELWQKVEDAILGFVYWYTQDGPPGTTNDMWYWSENHQIIFHTLEYLAGQTFPGTTFTHTGMTGDEHRAHAREKILRWLEHRMRFGFDEWHSNVYYQKDVTPLLTLVEFADDEEITQKASMVLDLVLFDLALHTFRGAFGVTHGRSYKKDKNTALDADTFHLTKMLFGGTAYPYRSHGDSGASLFARAKKYKLPQVIVDAATATRPFADRERMGVWIDEFHPVFTPYQDQYGFQLEVVPGVTEQPDLVVWWSMGALTVWQVLPMLWWTADMYGLWETDLFQPFIELRDAVGTLQFAQLSAHTVAHAAAAGLNKEVNTYTYRTADYMLSSAQDYRKGSRGWQYHSWQATFDANAIVFTTHPGHPPRENTDWGNDGEPGNWTGTASQPRSGQHENVAFHIYAPQYEPIAAGPFLDLTRYEPYTHAFFPQDHFDEVVRDGRWTFGRFADGYIALWSWRPAEFVDHGPTVPTNGMVQPFDLIADGGADNVWIVELGSASEFGDFTGFQDAIRGAQLDVCLSGSAAPCAGLLEPDSGFLSSEVDVWFDSPSQGLMRFGWEGELDVDGAPMPVADYPRYDNPWVRTEFTDKRYLLFDETTRSGLYLDHEDDRRFTFRAE